MNDHLSEQAHVSPGILSLNFWEIFSLTVLNPPLASQKASLLDSSVSAYRMIWLVQKGCMCI